MEFALSILGFVLLFGWIAYGLWPSGQNVTSAPHSAQSTASSDRDYAIGFAVGLAGGDVKDAAVAGYAIQRIEEKNGKPATTAEQTVASILAARNSDS
jgi:hypothetical protein